MRRIVLPLVFFAAAMALSFAARAQEHSAEAFSTELWALPPRAAEISTAHDDHHRSSHARSRHDYR